MGGGTTLPSGTVTFLFTDIEGSTRLLQDLGDRYEDALSEHRTILRKAIADNGGHEVGTEGDSFFVAFTRASDGVAAALQAQLGLGAHEWAHKPVAVRMGVHTGEAQISDDSYVGLSVHQAARISSAAHGGQVLVSQTTKDLAAGSMPDGATLVDLGEHRLKDLAQPTRLYNLAHSGLQAELPPPRTLSVLPNNLPLQLTTFVGRDEEIEKVRKLLETARLVTLSGAGGSGKTRLALQIAADLVTEHRDGAWLADLSPITDPELIMRGVAEALGVREEPDRAIDDVLIEFLQGKDLLVVVDNCEHMSEESAAVVDRLLHAASGLRVIATSRETLGAEGESVFRVPSLDTPKSDEPPEALRSYEAVRLFCDRAAQSTADFGLTNENAHAVTEICQRLDGMPLAIELAAARVRMLTPQEIAKRLDDRFKLLTGGVRTGIRRQQTLRAAVDWSYEMLSEAEQQLFRRLSVFVGGFTLEAAEGVCAGEGIDDYEVFDQLGNLVDRSLVVAEPHDGTTRYRLLETMREYGREALAASGEAADLWARHLDWFANLANVATDALEGAEEVTWLTRLDTELDNIRQALHWASSGGDVVRGLDLASSLYRYWFVRWYVAEGARWVSALLGQAAEVPDGLRAKALNAAAFLVMNTGNLREGRAYHEACLALPRTPDTKRWIAEATNDLALIIWNVDGDMDAAQRLLEEALVIRREIDFLPGIAESLNNVGSMASWRGDRAAAIPLIKESIDIREKLGARSHIAFGLSQLANFAAMDGDLTDAERFETEALAIRREIGDRAGTASSLNSLGARARQLGHLGRAWSLHEEALELCQSREDPFGIGETTYHMASAALEQGRYDDARSLFDQAYARATDLGAESYLAFTRDGQAALNRMLGNHEEAHRLEAEAVDSIRKMAPASLPTALAKLAHIERGRGRLDEAAAAADEALEHALRQEAPLWVAQAKYVKGLVELDRGNLQDAGRLLRDSLESRARSRALPWVAQSIEALGAVAAVGDRGDLAAKLLGAAEELRSTTGTVIHPADRAEHDEAVAKATASLGEDGYAKAFAEGRAMSLDDAVALALEP